jgi:hypothetical protein
VVAARGRVTGLPGSTDRPDAATDNAELATSATHRRATMK